MHSISVNLVRGYITAMILSLDSFNCSLIPIFVVLTENMKKWNTENQDVSSSHVLNPIFDLFSIGNDKHGKVWNRYIHFTKNYLVFSTGTVKNFIWQERVIDGEDIVRVEVSHICWKFEIFTASTWGTWLNVVSRDQRTLCLIYVIIVSD